MALLSYLLPPPQGEGMLIRIMAIEFHVQAIKQLV
jgi:hypothetical protein